jgi:hypothetical protein
MFLLVVGDFDWSGERLMFEYYLIFIASWFSNTMTLLVYDTTVVESKE